MALHILLLEISFYLPGCRSLKEKRRRLGRLADRAGKYHQIALTESGKQDDHQQSIWTFVILAAHRGLIDQHCARIETICAELDAVVNSIDREWLH